MQIKYLLWKAQVGRDATVPLQTSTFVTALENKHLYLKEQSKFKLTKDVKYHKDVINKSLEVSHAI